MDTFFADNFATPAYVFGLLFLVAVTVRAYRLFIQ